MIAEQYPGLLDQPDEVKLQLAAELWQDVIGDGTATDDEALAALMEERLAAYRAAPEQVSTWAEVKARLLASRR